MVAEPDNASQISSMLRQRFTEIYGNLEGICLACAPGRVNLLGDHTDYNDGFVLPMTIDRAVYFALRRREDTTVRLHSMNFDDSIQYSIGRRPKVPPGEWTSYVTGAIEELRRRGLVRTGFEGIFYGDVPLGGGVELFSGP